MKRLYDLGQAIWYYDEFENCSGIGIVLAYVEPDKTLYKNKTTLKHYTEIIVWDPNSNMCYNGYEENNTMLSLTIRDIAPLECYNTKEEFLKSRGVNFN